MTPDEALLAIRDAGLRGIFHIADHALDSMARRGAQYGDVRHGLANAPSCSLQSNGRWKVPSVDLDGDDLILIVAFDPDVLVVTIF